MSRRLCFLLSAGLLIFVLSAKTQATIHTINISNFMFSPQNVAVLLGDTVRWTIVTGIHTTTSEATSPKMWDSGNLSGGGTSFDLIIQPTDPTGDYPYFCQVHSLTMFDTLRVSAPPVSCCVPPIRGNVNNTGAVTVADLTYLVQFLFNSGAAPACTDEANVNGIGAITVADLTYLVQFLFNSGAQPAACP
jgi:plastocyanin